MQGEAIVIDGSVAASGSGLNMHTRLDPDMPLDPNFDLVEGSTSAPGMYMTLLPFGTTLVIEPTYVSVSALLPDDTASLPSLGFMSNITTGHSSVQFSHVQNLDCLLYTSPSPRDATLSRMPSSA